MLIVIFLIALCFYGATAVENFRKREFLNETKVAVIVFTGDNTAELISTVRHFAFNLPMEWRFQIFYQKEHVKHQINRLLIGNSLQFPPGLLDKYRLILTRVYPSYGLEGRESSNNFYVRNSTFWRSIRGERILMFHADSCLCSNSPHHINDFIHFDYIGAAWPTHRLIGPDMWKPVPINNITNQLYMGGNGGLSIRSRKSMIECALAASNGSFPHEDGFAEDMFFASCVKQYLSNQILPSRSTAFKFAIESTPIVDPNPLGCHKCFKYHTVETIAKVCPDAFLAMNRYTTKVTESSKDGINNT